MKMNYKMKEEKKINWEEEFYELTKSIDGQFRTKLKLLVEKIEIEAYREGAEKTLELLTKKIKNKKGEPLCPECGKDMERDVQEPQGHLWFCKCKPGLRLSVG